jgi:hypothetical protein
MLARMPQCVAQATLEGALCLARGVAQGLRAALPGLEVLTPDSTPPCGLAGFRAPGLQWFTVGAQFMLPAGSAGDLFDDDVFSAANDLVVPTQGCHEPGLPVNDSLHLVGSEVHHQNYFGDRRVRGRLAAWLTGKVA